MNVNIKCDKGGIGEKFFKDWRCQAGNDYQGKQYAEPCTALSFCRIHLRQRNICASGLEQIKSILQPIRSARQYLEKFREGLQNQ